MDEIYIRFMAQVTPLSVERLLNLIDASIRNGVSRIHLLLNSPGGSVSHGLAVYNFLRGVHVEVITHNLGTVDSIGVIIYCAGSKRLCVPHARFLIHPVQSHINGALDEHHLKEVRDSVATDQSNIAKVIGTTISKDSEEILKKMHDRTTMDSQQARDFGLVEEIKEEVMPANCQFEVVRESEAFPAQPMHFPPPVANLSPPPPDGQTNLYETIKTFTKAY